MFTSARKNFILYMFVAVALTIFFSIVFSLHVSVAAKAITFLELDTVTADELDDSELLSSQVVRYSQTNYEQLSYGRNITLKYNITDVSFLRFDTQIEGEAVVSGDIIDTQGLSSYSFVVDKNGKITVFCYAFDENMVEISSDTYALRSDMTAPDTYANINLMESYIGNASYSVAINWADFGDALSGRGRVFFAYKYDNSAISPIDITEVDLLVTEVSTIIINGKGTLTIFYFDKAGNCIVKEHLYKKFDIVPPPVPNIRIIPNVNLEQTSGYAKEYQVNIEYAEDTESGLSQTQYYYINGVTKVYYGSFTIKDVTDYTIGAYATDKVNNRSETVVANISKTSFDVDAPTVFSTRLVIDLTKETIATLSVEAKDEGSGIANFTLETLSKPFVKGTGDTYRVEFSPYNIPSVVFKIYDKVGNEGVHHYVINFFDDEEMSRRILNYNTTYLELNSDIYNERILLQLASEYSALSNMLMNMDTQDGQIYAKMSAIDELLAGRTQHTYEIADAPIVVSTILTYKITESDFESYKKGDSIRVVLSSAVSAENYVSLAGYKKGFSDYFALNIYYKGEEIESLTSGIEVTMNLPIGYYERHFTLIDMDTKEVMDTTIINNRIIFNCKKSSSFALVISGNREIALTNAPKYINLFGKKLPLRTFFGVVFGTIGGAIFVIGVIITIVAVRKKRHNLGGF